MFESEKIITNLLCEPLYMSRDAVMKTLMANPFDIAKASTDNNKEECNNTDIRSTLPPYAISNHPSFLKEGEEKIGRYTTFNKQDGIAVMRLHGPVIKDIDWAMLYQWYGRTADFIKVIDSSLVINELATIKDRPDIKGLVIDVDSPGGMVVGTPEMGQAIVEVKESGMPTISSVSTLSASAGYWISASTGYIIASSSARLPSVGVYMAMMDDTAMLERLGLKLEVIKSGKLKAIGLGSLDENQRKFLQKGIDKMHIEFKDHVRACMGDHIPDSLLEGQAVAAKDLVGTIVNELSSNPLKSAIDTIKAFI